MSFPPQDSHTGSHDILWAPWRSTLFSPPEKTAAPPGAKASSESEQPRDPAGCFLCRYLSAAESEDRSHLVLHRGPLTITTMNRYPYTNGHLLIAPRQHLGTLGELAPELLLECQQMLVRWMSVLQVQFRAQGFNVGLNQGAIAGAGLPGHLHWHLVPRWQGDQNFMPVVANVHLMPQALEAAYELLRTGWEQIQT